MTEFTPILGTIGGIFIGVSALILMAGIGRIAGMSGIYSGLFTLKFDSQFLWRSLFIIGLLAGALLAKIFVPSSAEISFGTNGLLTAISGLLVGVGVTLGSGCTSGHGICGLSRFSKRSLVATCTFMAVALVTVFVIRHIIGA